MGGVPLTAIPMQRTMYVSTHPRIPEYAMARNIPSAAALVLLGACAGDSSTGPAEGNLSAASASAASVEVVMNNLDSPRGLAWGPEGGLYVAEAGNTSVTGPCAPVTRGANCYSGTGAVSRLWKGRQERIASGLPSAYNEASTDIVGPQDISLIGRGNTRVTIGWGGSPASRAGVGGFGEGFGTLISVQPSGGWRVVADVTAFENTNPAGGPIDSNPYGVLAEPGITYVTDAGGNSLLSVAANGTVSLVAVFPAVVVPAGPFNPPFAQSEAVPTEVTRGPDGALYVSTLTGVPFLPGAASIYRVVPGQAPVVVQSGFKTIIDKDFGPDGSLHVLQHATGPFFSGNVVLIRIAPDGPARRSRSPG